MKAVENFAIDVVAHAERLRAGSRHLAICGLSRSQATVLRLCGLARLVAICPPGES
jgi:hypothetical protein